MRDYYQLPPRELGKNAKLPVLLTGDSGEAFYELAREMVEAAREAGMADARFFPEKRMTPSPSGASWTGWSTPGSAPIW